MKNNILKENLQEQGRIDAKYVLQYGLLEVPSGRYKSERLVAEYNSAFWEWLYFYKETGDYV